LSEASFDVFVDDLKLLADMLTKEMDLKALKMKYSPNEDRTLMIRFVDAPTPLGFLVVLAGDRYSIQIVKGEIPNPTVTAYTTMSTFQNIVMGKDSFSRAVFSPDKRVWMQGEFVLRDLKIFVEFEKELGKMARRLGLWS